MDNHALVYDLAGNLTSDPSADRKYEWDAFYRLRKVKTQGGAPVAEYRYNGLGHRIGTLEDTDLDSDVDGSDLWYYSSYDERWRMVATYRGSDADPKERFVHQQAGASGDGGSSYIDLVAFRERDANTAWTSASDGALEERIYYCQNQHADVVALVTDAGAQREMARYSAYGVPFGLPVGDTNSDGDCDQADQNQVRDWALATPAVYDVRGDLDLDGDVDLTDRDTLRDNYKGVTLGRGVLSAPLVRNQRGVAGYIAAGYEPSSYLIRHRVFPSELGVWASRDPLEYVDGVSLYADVQSNPVVLVDPSGNGGLKVAYRLCKIVGGRLKKGKAVSEELAVKSRVKGKNVAYTGNSRDKASIAGRLEKKAHPNGTQRHHSTGHGGKHQPHWQTDGVCGHTFYGSVGSILAAGSLTTHLGDSYFVQGLDFFNPLSVPADIWEIGGAICDLLSPEEPPSEPSYPSSPSWWHRFSSGFRYAPAIGAH